MSMGLKQIIYSGCVFILCAFPHPGWADDLKPDAKARAKFYQAETRTVLLAHHWTVSEDQAGRLVANRRDVPREALATNTALISVPTVAHLTITFRAQSVQRTTVAASIVAYYKRKGSPTALLEAAVGKIPPGDSPMIGPYPFDNPENKKEIEEMLVSAEKQLVVDHPEFKLK